MPTAIETQGTLFYISTVGSPESYTLISNVVNFSGPGGSANVIRTTNLSSAAHEKLMGLPDEGQFTLELNYDPDAASHILIRNARKNRTACQFKITLTDSTNTNLVFNGYVLGFQISGGVDDKVTASVTIEITGAVSEV